MIRTVQPTCTHSGSSTHPHGSPRNLPGVIKYLDRINRALNTASPEDLQLMSAATMRQALAPLGPVRSGTLPGGTAFGVEVTIGYWLVGPAHQPDLGRSPSNRCPRRISVINSDSHGVLSLGAQIDRLSADAQRRSSAVGRAQIARFCTPAC